jgi:hypothetical protein
MPWCIQAGGTKKGGSMSNIIQLVKREILGAIPPVIFFFIVFQLLDLTFGSFRFGCWFAFSCTEL